MNRIAEFNAEANAVTDREHAQQLQLLQALSEAVEDQASAAEVGRKLEELISFSEAHFMSEELLMRMKSYDEYEDHQDDHVNMLASMQFMVVAHQAGHTALIPGKVHDVLNFISQHIATRDKRLADYVRLGK